jgi:hypothetical protein
MPHDDPRSRRYRRWVVTLLTVVGLGVAFVGARMAWQGKGLYAVLALLVLGWLVLVLHGYRQEERERNR